MECSDGDKTRLGSSRVGSGPIPIHGQVVRSGIQIVYLHCFILALDLFKVKKVTFEKNMGADLGGDGGNISPPLFRQGGMINAIIPPPLFDGKSSLN